MSNSVSVTRHSKTQTTYDTRENCVLWEPLLEFFLVTYSVLDQHDGPKNVNTRSRSKKACTHVSSLTAGAICSEIDGFAVTALLAHTMYENLVDAMEGSAGELTTNGVL